jgi:hypothetical protein
VRTETADAIELSLPYLFAPRSYQWRVFDAWDQGLRRFGAVWHRRNGKDTTFLNFCIERMVERTGNYFHVFPKLNQGRRVIWDGINRAGHRVLDHFPPDLIYGTPNKADMQITLVDPSDTRKPGSTYQILGTDRNLDVLVGSNPVGVIFSEYALQNPRAWDLCRPILRENGGWAAFCYTPRGKNHGYTLFTTNRNNPDWYFELLDVTQTFRDGPEEDGSPVISPADIEADKREGMSQDLIDQEYYLSWEAAIPGAYYANEFRSVDAERRITRVPYDPSYQVYTFWDLGIDDATALWCVQFIGRQICCLHYFEDAGHGAEHYARYLATLPYQGNYRAHILPHDGHTREWGSGETRKQMLERLVQGVVETATRPNDVNASISNVRTIFPRLLFDETACERGIEALRSYHHDWNEQTKVFANYPDHDWSSHGADALRTLAVSLNLVEQIEDRFQGRPAPPEPVHVYTTWQSAQHAWMG